MRYVIAVAEQGGFQAAADHLNMAQPPLSRQIRALERELGVTLFQRRPTRLTAAGRVFVESARRVLTEAAQTVERTRLAAHGESGVVRLGHENTTTCLEVPKLLAEVRFRSPSVQVWARELWNSDLEVALHEGRFDVGLGRWLSHPPGFKVETLRRERLGVVLRRRHRLGRRERISLQHLRGERLGLFRRQLAPERYDQVLSALADGGERVEVLDRQLDRVHDLGTKDTCDFTILPQSVSEWLPRDFVWIPATDDLGTVDLEILWRPDDGSPAVDVVTETARQLARDERWMPAG